MKQVYFLLIGFITLSSCQKELKQKESDYMYSVKTTLKGNLSSQDYSELDFSRAILSNTDSVQLYFLRIPFNGKKIQNDFILLQTSRDGQVQKGKIIHLEGGRKKKDYSVSWNGSVMISSLNRKEVLQSAVTNGYIEAFHKKSAEAKLNSMMDPGMLPEVIVVAYVNDGISYSDWIWLQSLFYDSMRLDAEGSSGGSSSYYGSLDGSYGGSGGYYSGSTDPVTDVTTEPLMLVDIDSYVNNPAIDIAKYLKCFDAIPDAGSTCSVEIFTDIPVDTDPTKLFNWNTESPGHVFLQLKKSNGTQYALQNIGFYPSSNWKEVLDANPVDSKIVDDGGHEFNASLKMSLTPYQFRDMLKKAEALSATKYDTDQFNCTDFALDIFNYVRAPLEIPRYSVPGGVGLYGTRTPQGLYVKLREMKNNGDPEAPNITIGFKKAWVASSDGPCN